MLGAALMIWGLTGCSGTGASTVAAVWKQMGADVCSLDSVGHRFLDRKSVKMELETELGIEGLSGMSQGEIRELLREKAFSSSEVLAAVNRVIHPRLFRWVVQSAEYLKNRSGVFVLDGALIFELGLENFFSRIVTVTDELERVKTRLAKRDGISTETIAGRWRYQMDIKEKCNRSHFLICNSGTEELLRTNAVNFYKGIIQRMEEPRGTQN